MKKIIIWSILLIACRVSLKAQLFYYSYDKKIDLTPINKRIIKNDLIDNINYLEKHKENIVYKNNLYSVIECDDTNDLKGVISYPMFETKEGMSLGYTDEIVFSPKVGVDINDIINSFPIYVIKKRTAYILAKLSDCMNYDALTVANNIQESGLVKFSHPNFISTVHAFQDTIRDTYFPYQFYLHSTGQMINDGHFTSVDADINALEAWEITKGSYNIKVAVIDEGVSNNHPDLPDSRQIRLSSSNFASQFDGTNQDDPSPVNNDNHGNACAGIIGATHNNVGIAGIAPNCQIMPIRIPYGEIPAEVYAAAIEFAVNNGADIISNSWGYMSSDSSLYPVIVEAISKATTLGRNGKGCVVTFASGNTANRMAWYEGFVSFPANCGNDTIIVVGASDRNDSVAKYSPMGNISVVAPSHKAYPSQMQNEKMEIWSIDIPWSYGYNPNPEDFEILPNFGTDFLAYTGRFGGTSAACPQVAGVAALMLSVNKNLTAKNVKDIIETTTKKIGQKPYSIIQAHPNGTWNNDMGYGLVNAFEAVKKTKNIDICIRDTITDDGTMPCNVSHTWESPDIWIEDMNGNIVETPAGNTPYEVCVKIHNKSDYPSSGNEKLFLNWAKAGINDYWCDNWTENNLIQPCLEPMGGTIGLATGIFIPSIPANDSMTLRIYWETPSSERYSNCTGYNQNIWHFCLLARVHDYETIAHENEQQTGVYWLVRDHNNVAQKNIYLNQSASHKSVISISNPTSNYITRFLRLIKRNNNFEEKITDFAEISLKLDADLISSINYDLLTGAKFVNDNTLLITDDDFALPLQLAAGQYSTLSTSVNFLTNKTPQNDTTHFDIVAYTDEYLSEIASGQGYQNIYTTGRTFHANAGNDTAILIGTNAVLHATQINEDATYRWYDIQRNFKYEGLNYIVTPSETSEYILEITALGDGYRDLDTVKVNVVPGCIRSITPNPVSDNWVTVSYEYATMVTSAHLYIYNTGTTTLVGSYDLSNLGNVSSLDIEVTNYPTGSYTVVLVCDNAVCHNKVLIRQ